MPKKRASVVLEKVSRLMGIPILIHKLKKPPPNCLNLILLIKSRKFRKSFKLLRHYNYEFVQEYEFSASSTPLIRHSPKERKAKNRDLCSILLVFTCFGVGREEAQRYNYPIEGLARFDELEDATLLNGKEEEAVESMSDSGVEEGFSSSSVDERAEKFIQMFYQQMRMQRRESL